MMRKSRFWPRFYLICFSFGAQRIMVTCEYVECILDLIDSVFRITPIDLLLLKRFLGKIMKEGMEDTI